LEKPEKGECMSVFRHMYYAIRYGTWEAGWDGYSDRYKFGFKHTYYDGDWITIWFFKFYVAVNY